MDIKPRDNFFLAVLVDAAANDRVQKIADEQAACLGAPRYWTPRDCRHISIAGVGDGRFVTQETLEALSAGIAGFEAPAFRVTFNRFLSWPGRSKPWVLVGDDGVAGFQMLLDALRLKLRIAGLHPPWPATVTPHMTLARHGAHAQPVPIDPVSWTVGELALVQSHVGEGRYTIVGRWRLRPPAMAAYPNRAA